MTVYYDPEQELSTSEWVENAILMIWGWCATCDNDIEALDFANSPRPFVLSTSRLDGDPLYLPEIATTYRIQLDSDSIDKAYCRTHPEADVYFATTRERLIALIDRHTNHGLHAAWAAP